MSIDGEEVQAKTTKSGHLTGIIKEEHE